MTERRNIAHAKDLDEVVSDLMDFGNEGFCCRLAWGGVDANVIPFSSHASFGHIWHTAIITDPFTVRNHNHMCLCVIVPNRAERGSEREPDGERKEGKENEEDEEDAGQQGGGLQGHTCSNGWVGVTFDPADRASNFRCNSTGTKKNTAGDWLWSPSVVPISGGGGSLCPSAPGGHGARAAQSRGEQLAHAPHLTSDCFSRTMRSFHFERAAAGGLHAPRHVSV